MLKILFAEFHKGEYEDLGYELYLLRDSDGAAMYIGIAKDSICHRWFDGGTSHMESKPGGGLYGKSVIGEVVERRFPISWKWTIELWTREDCLRACNVDYLGKDIEKLNIESIESQMIVKFEPLYNVTHSGGRHEDPLVTRELNDIYKDIFG
jgi:hypothetical protein